MRVDDDEWDAVASPMAVSRSWGVVEPVEPGAPVAPVAPVASELSSLGTLSQPSSSVATCCCVCSFIFKYKETALGFIKCDTKELVCADGFEDTRNLVVSILLDVTSRC